MKEMKLEVDCYSGRTADERPVRFRLDGHEYMVEEVLDQWYGPSDSYFKVRADDGNIYVCAERLRRPTDRGVWSHFGNCHDKDAALLRTEALRFR